MHEATATNRREQAANARNVPNQSTIKAPAALPETQSSNAAPRLCELVAISAELSHRVEEYAELNGLTVDGVVTRALIDRMECGNRKNQPENAIETITITQLEEIISNLMREIITYADSHITDTHDFFHMVTFLADVQECSTLDYLPGHKHAPDYQPSNDE